MKKKKASTKSVLTTSEARAKSLSGLVTYAANTGVSMLKPLVGSDILDMAGGVAQMLGFDDPRDLRTSAPVVNGCPRDFSAGTGLSGANMLSKYPDSLPGMVFSSTVGDDMSIIDMCSQYSLLSISTIQSSSAIGTTFLTVPVNPKFPGGTAVVPILDNSLYMVTTPTWLSIMSQPFTRWRGTLHYKMVINASAFSTARLRVYFVPGVDDSYVLPTTPAVEFWNEIIEISGNTEYEFSIPFLFPLPYSQQSIGRIGFQIVNPPAPVGDVIPSLSPMDLQLFVRGGSDLELADPSGRWFVSTDPLTREREEPVLQPESGFGTAGSVKIDGGPYTNEPFNHLSQLIHAPEFYAQEIVSDDVPYLNRIISPAVYGITNDSTVTAVNFLLPTEPSPVVRYSNVTTHQPDYAIWPVANGFKMTKSNTSPTGVLQLGICALSALSQYYYYWRGGIRYHLMPQNPSPKVNSTMEFPVLPTVLSPMPSSTSTMGYNLGIPSNGILKTTASAAQPCNDLSGVFQVEVPWKSSQLFGSTNTPTAATQTAGVLSVESAGLFKYYISAADDFRFILPKHPGLCTLISTRVDPVTGPFTVVEAGASNGGSGVTSPMWNQVMLY